MPKIINHPNASFIKSLELAETIESLGASCSRESAAHALSSSSTSGSFKSLISAAQKYNLITTENGKLTTSSLYKEIHLSYTDEDARVNKIKAFLAPLLFVSLYQTFKNKKLPIAYLSKLVVKEHEVEKNSGSRIAVYFVEGLKMLGLINDSEIIIDYETDIEEKTQSHDLDKEIHNSEAVLPLQTSKEDQSSHINGGKPIGDNHEYYFIHVFGPGMDTKIRIQDEIDLTIVEATLVKVKQKLNAK